jgi:hypothetical protein
MKKKFKIEVAKYKSKMEVEVVNFALYRERQKNKFHSMQMKYKFTLACSWGLVLELLFYPSSNILALRLMFP